MAQLDQMVRSGAVSVTEVDSHSVFICFQCFHRSIVQFQLQYPATLQRTCAGGTVEAMRLNYAMQLCFVLCSSLGTEGIWL